MAKMALQEQLSAIGEIVPNEGEILYTELQKRLMESGAFDATGFGWLLTGYGYKFRTEVSGNNVRLFVRKGGE